MPYCIYILKYNQPLGSRLCGDSNTQTETLLLLLLLLLLCLNFCCHCYL